MVYSLDIDTIVKYSTKKKYTVILLNKNLMLRMLFYYFLL
jgi:hypothetical protein